MHRAKPSSRSLWLLISLLAGSLLHAEGNPPEPASDEELQDLDAVEVKADLYSNTEETLEEVDLHSQRQVDIIFVVDNSVSMRDEQALLAAAFNRFIGSFSRRKLDFHVGILTTDALDGVFRGRKSWGQPWLTSSSPNLVEDFESAVRVGTRGSRAETALRPLAAALQRPENRDFFRPKALLYMVVVSDEDEGYGPGFKISDRYLRDDAGALEARLEAFHKQALAFKGGRPGLLRLDVVTGPEVLPPKASTDVSGLGLMRVAERFQGRSLSICEDFSESLIAIGEQVAAAAQSRFTLRYPAIKPTLEVRINGTEIEEDGLNGWTYEVGPNALVLHGEALRQSFDAKLTIQYSYSLEP